MDNSSYQEARLQLIKMFNKPSDFRHIIFWYDPNGDFLDDGAPSPILLNETNKVVYYEWDDNSNKYSEIDENNLTESI